MSYMRVYTGEPVVYRARAKKVITGPTVVALVFGCALSRGIYVYNYYIMVLYIALYAVVLVTVLGKSFMSTTALLLMSANFAS